MTFKQFFESETSKLYVGVVGFSGRKFDTEKAKQYIKEAFDNLDQSKEIYIVSGLTALGIPLLAYQEAVKRNWKTVGVACKLAKDYEVFSVDIEKIVGENWGDESQTFLDMLDCIIRVGGGKQSFDEIKKAKEMGIETIEYELEELK